MFIEDNKLFIYNDEHHKIPEFEVKAGTVMFKPSGEFYLISIDGENYNVLAKESQLYTSAKAAYRQALKDIDIATEKKRIELAELYVKKALAVKATLVDLGYGEVK